MQFSRIDLSHSCCVCLRGGGGRYLKGRVCIVETGCVCICSDVGELFCASILRAWLSCRKAFNAPEARLLLPHWTLAWAQCQRAWSPASRERR